jgi:asparagine synthase (glutamine-hydrolysing)
MNNEKGKIILKEAVRNLIPAQVVDRPKQGLFAPFVEWFHAGMGERMQQKVLGFAAETGLLKKKEVSAIFSKNPNRAWPLYSFTLWHQHFFDS